VDITEVKVTTSHENHLIKSIPMHIPDSSRWKVKVLVEWHEGENYRSVPFTGPIDGLASEAEAESWGIQFGKKWIGDGKPDLRELV